MSITLDALIQNFHLQKEEVEKIITKYDEDFANKKLNPYGVTTIEFQKRSDAYAQKSRLEGAIDALFIVKRDIMGDDTDVNIPMAELDAVDTEMEIIGNVSEENETEEE
tara:strand:+ start:6006 stop:6332 length:327 start_codon:yes stop_codon:yes gene_type:complete